MPEVVADIAELASRYCRLIEASGMGATPWLGEVADLLPRLHAAVLSLEGADGEDEEPLAPDLDARFELFTHLRELLGERDGYWLEFDRMGEHRAMTGSLADDLTDIYCELKHGLRVQDLHPQLAGGVGTWDSPTIGASISSMPSATWPPSMPRGGWARRGQGWPARHWHCNLAASYTIGLFSGPWRLRCS